MIRPELSTLPDRVRRGRGTTHPLARAGSKRRLEASPVEERVAKRAKAPLSQLIERVHDDGGAGVRFEMQDSQAPDYGQGRGTRTKRQATLRISESARPQAARRTRQTAAAPEAAAPQAAAPQEKAPAEGTIVINSDDDQANEETIVPGAELPTNYVGFRVRPRHQKVLLLLPR